jgi:hypothetical protein
MPYTQGTDFISDTNEVRRLSRNVVTGEFADDKIKSWQYKAYSKIRTLTDKDDWDTADREYGELQAIESELAASYILEHYGDDSHTTLWQSIRSSAMDDLTNPKTGLIANMDTSNDESATEIDRTDFKGWGKNTNLSPPNRLDSGIDTDIESF